MCLILSACQAPLVSNDWSNYDGPGAQYFQKEEVVFPSVDDPVEPLNRAISSVNHVVIRGIISPIGWVYRKVVPFPVGQAVSNAFNNLLYPPRLVNEILQGDGAGAWHQTKRFAVNSTVGVLGLGDPASKRGLEVAREDLGQTFGKWGWRDSTYIVLPLMGPSSVRDTVGRFGDAVVDPASYFPPATAVRAVHSVVRNVNRYEEFVRSNFDPYELSRLLYSYNRLLLLDDYDYDLESDMSGEVDTLSSVFWRHEDRGFPGRGKTHKVEVPTTGERVTYTVWLTEEPQSLVYFLPGTGGHRLSGAALAIAESIHESNKAPVTISSTLNFEFIEDGLSSDLPGYLPSDARDVHATLDAIDHDLISRYPGRFSEKRGLVGLSLGGMQTLAIAAREADPQNEWLDFDIYLSIDAPVELDYAIQQLDGLYNAPMQFPKAEREQWILEVLRKVLDLARGTMQPTQAGLPFTSTEAEFLIGMAFRSTVRDVIYQTQERNDRGVLKTKRGGWSRTSANQEIAQFSFMEYIYAFLLPYCAEQNTNIDFSDAGAKQLFADCSLRSLEEQLAGNPKVRYVGNTNDFLVTPEDIEWVRSTLGEERVLFFERGGHGGNLHEDDVKNAIRQFVGVDVPVPDTAVQQP